MQVLIEATPSKFEELHALYACQPDVTCLRRLVGLTEGDRLHDILSRTAIPRDFDLLSVDIDGADYHIWDSLPPPPAGYAPKVVVIEFNPTIPNNILYVQVWRSSTPLLLHHLLTVLWAASRTPVHVAPPQARDVQVQRGSSLLALAELGKRKGYELVSTTKFNAIFVQARYFPLFDIADNRVSAMHATLMPSYLFQLYDGTLMLAGCRKLIWHKTPITHEALQVLPRARRRFPFAPDHDEAADAGEGGGEGRCVDSLVTRGRRLLLAERDFEGLECLRLATAEARRTEERALSRVSDVYREVGEDRVRRHGPRDGVEWYQRAYHLAHAHCSADRQRQLALKIGHCLYCDGEDGA